MGAWGSWRDPPRRGRLAGSAPDRDRPRRRHLHHAPSPPPVVGRTARVPAAFAPAAIEAFDWLALSRAAATGADGGGLVGGADLGQERHAPVSPDAPDRATSAMRPARGRGCMTTVGGRRAAHARRLRRPRRRALHRSPFPPVAVAALDGADARNQTETLLACPSRSRRRCTRRSHVARSRRGTRRHLRDRCGPHQRAVLGPPHDDQQRARRVHQALRQGGRRRRRIRRRPSSRRRSTPRRSTPATRSATSTCAAPTSSTPPSSRP